MPDQIYTIIVADDEEELRDAMCRMIDWQSAGFRLVASAGNGLEALQFVEQYQPDLLLTDIQMPFITGTALAKQVRELQPLIQVAFLTGYDDFEYARSAIDNRVIAYLLKPVTIAGLTGELKKIHASMEKIFKEYMPVEEHTDLSSYVCGMALDPFPAIETHQERLEKLESKGMEIHDPSEFIVIAAQAEKGEGIPAGMAKTADQVLRTFGSSASFIAGQRLYSLVSYKAGSAGLDQALDELYYVLKRVSHKEYRIGAGKPFTDLTECFAASKQAVEVLQRSEDYGPQRYSSDPLDNISILVNKTLVIIQQQYMDERLSLDYVSQQLHVSPNYLSANMKKVAGDTFINLLIKRRMEAAKELISGSALRIGEIAERCGYSDQHYFSYCFKKYYGISPVQLRRGEGHL